MSDNSLITVNFPDYGSIINTLPLVVWTAAPDGGLTYISQQWETIYGNPLNESLGNGWTNFVHPDDLAEAATLWAHSLASGKNYETEFRVKHKAGDYHWILVRAVPNFNTTGEIVSWNGSNTDIHEKRLAEEEARKSEEKFRTMADHIPNLAWMANADGWIYWYNKQWYHYTGTTPTEMEGWGWQSVHDPEELPRVLEKWKTSIERGEPFEMTFPLRGADGKFNMFLTRVLPVKDLENKIYQWFGTNTDITQSLYIANRLKESEENLRNTIIQAPVAMCILKGKDFVVDLANSLMFNLWGKSSEEVLHKPIFEGLPESKNQGLEILLEGVFKTGKPFVAQGMAINLPRNGVIESVFINFVYQAFKSSDGIITGVIVVAIDVTEQIVARQKIESEVTKRTIELALSNRNLQKSNDELAQFAYIASHDLQEPLRKISTFTNMLENRLPDVDEQSKKYIKKIQDSSDRMSILIRDVLAYSELVKEKEIFEKVDLNKIMESALLDFELRIEQKKAEVKFKNLPVIDAIPLQMSQLFGNLLGNALKFAQADVAPKIIVTSRLLDEDEIINLSLEKTKQYHKIEFTDNGIGFNADQADRIFNIFQRLHQQSEYSGTGIGLAMCKKIVVNHQGRIEGVGNRGEGAVFIIILPATQ